MKKIKKLLETMHELGYDSMLKIAGGNITVSLYNKDNSIDKIFKSDNSSDAKENLLYELKNHFKR